MTITTQAGSSYNAAPFLYGEEEAAMCEALRSGYYNHSAVTDQFEAGVARFLDVEDTVAVASGTAALQVALLAARIGPGHEVVVPSFTFCATVQAILATGASPRFAEINPSTLCTGSAEVLEAVTPSTRAVMPVLYGGRAVDLTEARPVLAERGITVVEDAAHAFGSCDGTRRVGATGQATTCFSFGPIKNLTCGQGGMIVPRGAAEAGACRRLRSLGIAAPAAARGNLTTYSVDSIGLRAQMPSLNAAIGLAQLAHFAQTENTRKTLWRAYTAALDGIDGIVLVDADIDRTVPHLCAVRVLDGRDRVFRRMRESGIGVGAHYPPNHLQPAFERWGRTLPVTEQVGKQIMTLPFHQYLTQADIDRVTSELRNAVRAEAAR